ncbi:MAG: GNAT family N-acetyltransferase [Acidimicrobiia bacterium]|nr:GNAT family N-acetyltransferase [Acidimicrobiia bacterium]
MTITSTPFSTPPGYPHHFEERVSLAEGRSVFIRPIVPSDAAELAFELEHSDPETLYNRFFRSGIRVNEELLTHLTVLDYDRRFALAAFAESGVAIARYEGSPGSDEAEMAVAVKPQWRRLGLATLLLDRLQLAAREQGITTLRADFLAENEAARALIARAGFEAPVYQMGVGSVRRNLTRLGGRAGAIPQ